jgi:hypothetical protein
MDSNTTNQTVDQISTEISIHKFDSNPCTVQDHATQIYQSKMARKTAKPNVTHKINEINEIVKDVNNLEHVQSIYITILKNL